MSIMTANELKRNGVTGIDRAMLESDEQQVLIDVRGKTRYIILGIEAFDQYREYQLDKAIQEAEICLKKGEFSVIDEVDSVIAELKKSIADDA